MVPRERENSTHGRDFFFFFLNNIYSIILKILFIIKLYIYIYIFRIIYIYIFRIVLFVYILNTRLALVNGGNK